MTSFTMDCYQNEYLPAGAGEMHAILTVTAAGGAPTSAPSSAAEIIIVDVSGSMDFPRSKIKAAKVATAAAIDCLRDGVLFGVVAGTDTAVVYPGTGDLIEASERTRGDAKNAVSKLKAGGGTAIGQWLRAANGMFETSPAAVRHAILLTDGANENETSEELDDALAECAAHFQCDCRGVGTDWRVDELRTISTALLGTVDIIAEPEEMAADFTFVMHQAMARATADVKLRVWIPQGASVKFIRQVAPAIEDLTSKAAVVDERTTEYPTGAWGVEARDYHVCIELPASDVGEEVLAGRIGLNVDGEVSAQSLVRATWTDDRALSTRINREVAHYTGQAELADAIQSGLESRKLGADDDATEKLGRAVQLAAESGNEATLKLLAAVVDIDDPVTGTVRLKRGPVDKADEMTLDTRSTKTVRISGPDS